LALEESKLIETLAILLLVPDISPDSRFVVSHGRDPTAAGGFGTDPSLGGACRCRTIEGHPGFPSEGQGGDTESWFPSWTGRRTPPREI